MATAEDFLTAVDEVISDGVRRGLLHNDVEDDVFDGRHVTVAGRRLVNFGSCSYLGLETDPRLKAAVRDAVDRHGMQFSSSRAYASAPLYRVAESELAALFGRPVIVTPSTTMGHIAAMPTLMGSRDALVLDHQAHHSVQTAAKLVQAGGARWSCSRTTTCARWSAGSSSTAARNGGSGTPSTGCTPCGYRAVHARAVDLNVFPLPRRLIDAVLESPAFEVLVLRLADRPRTAGGQDIVAFAVQHVTGEHVAPLFVGLDYTYVPTHSSYQVLLLQALRSAQRHGARRVLLGMGADLHKARFEGRREKRWAYVAANETYNADVVAHIAETVSAR